MRSRGLNKKHLKALELLKTTDLPIIEVAKQSGLAEFHPLIRGQPFYDQSSSPCKSFRLNGEYKYLQLLLPQNTYHRYIFSFIYQEINQGGGDP